ncbi:hypothetical protein EDC04DRAFT_3098184 [Pisolithus marmoratus]|nr:hypothetical protein EDC04DRAFT_3098184 [Pisolithus marmoratus]
MISHGCLSLATRLGLLTDNHDHAFRRCSGSLQQECSGLPPSAILDARVPFVIRRAQGNESESPDVVSRSLCDHLTISASLSSYEKEVDDNASEPHVSSAGTRTYVVSEPDPSNTAYEVPYGAYPTSAPYVNYLLAGAPPNLEGKYSSTSTTQPHPYTTSAHTVPQNKYGIGESAAMRNAEAPGEMGRRGGSYGGLGLMDEKTTTTRRTCGIEFWGKNREQSFRP